MAKDTHALVCIGTETDKGKLEYENLDTQIWDWMVKNQGAHGTHWANPVIHPATDALDGWYAIPVDLSRMGGALTTTQRERVEILTPDWFTPE